MMTALYSIHMGSFKAVDVSVYYALFHASSVRLLTHCTNQAYHRPSQIYLWTLLLVSTFFISLELQALPFISSEQIFSSRERATSRVPLLYEVTSHYENNFERQPVVVCNVSDYGAIGNGEVLNTGPIQAAIDSCASKGGGIVYFPPGDFLTGTVFLKSNILLHVDEGASILGSPNQADYPPTRSQWYVILAQSTDHVGITGGGIVDGQGLKFVTEFNVQKNVMVSWNTTNECFGDECRPRLIGFVDCQYVHIWNVHLQQPAYWCLHIVNSNQVSIHDISIQGDFNTPNNDGIDIESSNNTKISHCHIDTGDDAICPKTEAGPLYNLSVAHCWIRTKSCAVKLGSRTNYALSGLHFEHLIIVDSHRGLGLQLRDSGNIYDVTFANINISTQYYDQSWWGRAEPIYVTACPRDPSTVVGSIYNVSFVNITAKSENGIFLAGSKGGTLNGLTFSNISVELIRSTNYSGGLHDYRPGCQGLVPSRTAGIFMEYAFGLSFHYVNLTWIMGATSDWDLPVDFTPHTIGKLQFLNFQSDMVNTINDGSPSNLASKGRLG
ncbi:hypothetical protein O6H91_01G042800 [Diphasiastrum complanatum]|uniref:Uncharacterized protein n=1 Tax=Diphasiastrum complanatum TaxID=34168 RepID=A0ACC2EQB8_DIPCM|nr:hypothetical protein O6H91_Y435000 [Diphasiastrum complanatum]KAJ7568665.1 hypothetical protein O6H91_01G042800 [Diphasiastrum complanatum]